MSNIITVNQRELDKIREHPFHHYLGVETIDIINGKSIIPILVTDRVLNPAGTFHGGVLYTLCDVAAFSALMAALSEGEIGVTNNISVQAMRVAQLGDRLIFTGRIIKLGKRLAFIETEVMKGDQLIAKASITKTLIRLKK